jgi:hypothetical protein
VAKANSRRLLGILKRDAGIRSWTIEGDDDVILVNKKSVIQLQEHLFDHLQQRMWVGIQD